MTSTEAAVGNGDPKPVKDRPSITKELAHLAELNRSQRLGISPELRIVGATAISGLYGLLTGFYNGYNQSSLQYLAENAHRLPRTKGAWYFYYKRKNYVVLKASMIQSVRSGVKFGTAAMMYFGIEAYLDHVRHTIDFISTIASSGTVGVAYGIFNKLGRKQIARSARSFMAFGAIIGLTQDGMRFARGNDVWYLRFLRRN
ncbi:hypothetical protein AWJ20_1376 [Sugiyamaella lignohabitans]|uniref:Uncharacterized protein n=1 Tax=Sugiyamaella lignohabitans TaxID=796027 RepID=A0A161HJW0_9ASCO|nr:uncharacterized protein AWJ20_1376 [Sugiyamaella lignohabitans]ANB13097.1 hypothetical protein AWJ20_1376 [Sugiyamaella lignohabitans]